MKKVKNIPSYQNKPLVGQAWQLVLLSMVLIIVFAITIWNASSLHDVLDTSTREYVGDVAYQLASDISSRMEGHQLDLQLMADSIARVDGGENESALRDFLKRKEQIVGFDAFVILDRSGNEIRSSDVPQGLLEQESVQRAFEGEKGLAYLEGQSLLYTVPVYTEGQVTSVLAGVRNKENVQALIQPKNFWGQSLTCITDDEGQVVISPTDLKPFLELDSIWLSGDEKAAQDILAMKDDLRRHQAGVFRFTSVDGKSLLMSYNALGVNDWMLLTLVPADLIAAEASRYTLRTFMIIGGLLLLFFLFLTLIIRFYRIHRRQLERIAFVDPVTGGINNAAFQLRFQARKPSSCAVILLNLKGFKLINADFGVEAGNHTLRYIYDILLRHLGPDEFAARGEADNFFLCLQESDRTVIQSRLDEMIADINAFNDGREMPYYLTIQQGACLVDDSELDITLIQDRARTAYQNREMGDRPTCIFYDLDFTRRLQMEQELNGLFEASIENHEFQVYLQPKVRLENDAVCGAEALVRWIHPHKGTIYPSDFIPLIEQNGKICKLDYYMFEEVCILLNRWRQSGRALLPISVNLSRQHFKNPAFLEAFSRIARRYHIPAGIIEFELTESIFFDNRQLATVQRSIKRMHELGFLCSLDDFGAGFSSLGLLKEFDVDTIKLDRQFFLDISNAKAKDIIFSLIDLAEKLEVQTVAEGIETPEQLSYLRAAGCDMVQGYIYAKPMPAVEFEIWWDKREQGGRQSSAKPPVCPVEA